MLTIFLIFVSSLPSSVEGQKLGQNPWKNFQRFGRRLSNRNRANDRRGRPVGVPARRRPQPSAALVDGREGKTVRNRANNRNDRRNNRPGRINGRNDRSNTRNDRIVKPVSVAASPKPNFSPRPNIINGRIDRSNTRGERRVQPAAPITVAASPKPNFSPTPNIINGRIDRSNTRGERRVQPAAPITVAASPKPNFSHTEEDLREGKNLRNTFPFNTGAASTAGHHDHHDHHHHDHGNAAAGNGRRGFGLTPPAKGVFNSDKHTCNYDVIPFNSH